MTSPGWPPRVLPIDDDATWWSVPRHEVDTALQARPLVLLLHGLGAHERDLAPLVPLLPPEPVYAALRAPLPVRGTPGFGWFAPRDGERVRPDGAAADAAAAGVLAWLERTQARVRTPGEVGLLGFSQGGALAVQLLRHRPETFRCAVVMAGFLATGLVGGDEALTQIRPPVLWTYDPTEPVVTTADTDPLRAFLTGHCKLLERPRPGVGHGIDAVQVDEARDFLAEHLVV